MNKVEEIPYYFKSPKDKNLKERMKAVGKQKGFDLKGVSIIAIEEYLKRNEKK